MSDREHPFGHGRLAYIQIPALDANESAAFYKDIFGWQVRGGTPAHLSFTDTTGDVIGAFVTDRVIATRPGII
ncbi:MAG TPA: VOC family protein, partial [Vicinamibacterales bacterium]